MTIVPPQPQPVPQPHIPIKRLMDGLIANDYTFVTSELSAEQMQREVATFDENRSGLMAKMFGLGIGMSDVPGVMKFITKNVVGFGSEAVDTTELAQLRAYMHESFPLCAFSFSRIYGPRFLAIVDGDAITQEQFLAAVDRFEQVNVCMLQLGGRVALKLFGKTMFGINSSAASGTLVVLANTTGRAAILKQWAAMRPLHSDTIVNQMRQRFTSVKFWAKALVGFIEYTPHQLRQEIVVVDGLTRQASSTASPRLPFEFGFSLDAIV